MWPSFLKIILTEIFQGLVMCFEFSICWRTLMLSEKHWTFCSLSLPLLKRNYRKNYEFYKPSLALQKFLLSSSITVPGLFWKVLSWSLVSINFQASLLLITGISSSPVQWVTPTKGWGSSSRVSQLSVFSVGCATEIRHGVADGDVDQDWKQVVEKGWLHG